MTSATFHKRPLPADLVAFGSGEGRRLLVEAVAEGTAEAFFPLVANLHTQADPAWCGLGTLVTVLNALEIDPGRTWKGSWRWFGEELLTCCKTLDVAAAEGLSLSEVAYLARCNGADVQHTCATDEGAFRDALSASVRGGPFLVANYLRTALGQTGAGHFSPIAAWHAASDHLLVLDVARFKYPPHWVPVSRLFQAMTAVDPATGLPRGWMLLERAAAVPDHVAGAEALAARLEGLGACIPPLPR